MGAMNKAAGDNTCLDNSTETLTEVAEMFFKVLVISIWGGIGPWSPLLGLNVFPTFPLRRYMVARVTRLGTPLVSPFVRS